MDMVTAQTQSIRHILATDIVSAGMMRRIKIVQDKNFHDLQGPSLGAPRQVSMLMGWAG